MVSSPNGAQEHHGSRGVCGLEQSNAWKRVAPLEEQTEAHVVSQQVGFLELEDGISGIEDVSGGRELFRVARFFTTLVLCRQGGGGEEPGNDEIAEHSG